jgi:TonB-linked SusC/RagA family outer membrane protein
MKIHTTTAYIIEKIFSPTFLAMKFTIILLVFCSLQSFALIKAQKVSLNVKDKEISKILSLVEKQSEFRFVFNSRLKDLQLKATVNAEEITIDELLEQLFTGTALTYKLLSTNLIAIKSNNPDEQDIRVTGRVTSESGEPLAGVSVTLKGTKTGTTTDNNGMFAITVPENGTLVFSTVGYNNTEVAVGGKQQLTVSLVQSTKKMDEVVVIGYGTANKRDLTGSIVKISGKEVADKPNTNPIASLQAKVAGLSVVNNGTPGEAPDIRIRGTISIGSVRPLFVVDGIFNDNIDYINPSDIESIEILKDPSSLAIFGVRGAAGVIMVTTKRAKAGQITINYNFSIGTKKLVDKIKWANANEFRELYEEEKVNIGATAAPPIDYNIWNGNTDWIDAVTRTGRFNSHNLSLAASTEKNKFTMGVGYVGDEGLIKHQKLERILFSLNDEFKINKGIKIGFNFNGTRQNSPYGYAVNALNDARKAIPNAFSGTKTVFTKNPYGIDSTNQVLYYELPFIQNSGVVNPLIRMENEWDKTIDITYRTVASVFAEINFLRDFTFRSTVYADMSSQNKREYKPVYNSYDISVDKPFLVSSVSGVTENDYSYRRFQQDHILSYKKRIGEHSFNASAGFTTYENKFTRRIASVQQSTTGGAIPNDRRFWYISNGFGAQASQRSSSDQWENATVSGLFRVLYNYGGKYYLNASFRSDASSQISPNNRWQNFWAVGAAWELSKEAFMSNVKAIDFLKLKASIGVLGNQNTYVGNPPIASPYPYYPGLQSGTSAGTAFGNLIYNAFAQAYLPDRNLKWETVFAKEIGVELNALSNRLHFEASYFDKVTKDLLTYVPGNLGVADGLTNVGSIQNNGLELTASWTQKVSKDLVITFSGNLTTYRNKVLELATKDYAIVEGPSRTIVGEPIGVFYGYIVEGIYQSFADKLGSPINTEFTYGPGDFKYKDVNGDGVIDTKDRTVIGNPTPDFTYGGSISLNYKGFDVSVDLGGVYGNEIYRNWAGTEPSFQRVNYAAFVVNRWRGEGTSNWVPILGNDRLINNAYSSYGIEDGSYFRIRNLQAGYNFTQTVASKVKAKSIRLFANVQNLKTFKRNLGYTPEFGGTATRFGVDDAGGAIPVVTTFGLNITF